MIAAILEKASFGIPALALYMLGRLSPQMLVAGSLDLILGIVFVMAYSRTGQTPSSR